MGLFSRTKADSVRSVVAVFHLNSRLQPIHRGSVFEDPLEDQLAERHPGSSVVGGGTEFTPETGPLSCDIEVELLGDTQGAFRFVIDALENLGAPVGSWARIGDGPQIPFGVTHGLALSLDGVSLPLEVYKQNDINDLIGTLTSELGEAASLQSWWEGAERTNLYFYGRDVDSLQRVLGSAADRFPLAQKSTLEVLTG